MVVLIFFFFSSSQRCSLAAILPPPYFLRSASLSCVRWRCSMCSGCYNCFKVDVVVKKLWGRFCVFSLYLECHSGAPGHPGLSANNLLYVSMWSVLCGLRYCIWRV